MLFAVLPVASLAFGICGFYGVGFGLRWLLLAFGFFGLALVACVALG